MTATAERPVAKKGRKDGPAAAPMPIGLPQVNLLPPEVRAARSLSVVKRWLGISLLILLVVIGLGYAAAVMSRSSADAELADADATTLSLRAEEREYAEVPRVLGALTTTEQAVQSGMALEVTWKPFVDAVATVLPAGVSIDQFTLNGPSPFVDSSAPSDPLQTAGIGSMSFELRSSTPLSTADVLDAIGAVPGLDSPWVSSVAVTEEEGTIYYKVSASAQLTEVALAQRFADTEGE